jgi:hypothetical protein
MAHVGGHAARMEEARNTYKILVENLRWKRPLWRSKARWLDNIKVYIRHISRVK